MPQKPFTNSSTILQTSIQTQPRSSRIHKREPSDPKYRTEWIKESVEIDETQANNPKLNITLKGTTNPEVSAEEYSSDVEGGISVNQVKIFIDDTDITNIIEKGLHVPVYTTNSKTGTQEVLQILVLYNFEEAVRQTGKSYKEWSGNIRVEIAQGTLTDTTYGNKNMSISEDGNRKDSQVEDEIKVDRNTVDAMFADFIKPEIVYQYSDTDINYTNKSFTMEISITDKYISPKELVLNDFDIKIDGETPDWTEIDRAFSSTPIRDTVDGINKIVGYTYRLTLNNLEQLQVKEGDKYLDYSGVVTVAIGANKITDTSGNGNNATTITSGIDLPEGTGTAEIVDVVKPLVEKIDSSVDVKNRTAQLTFQVTDKYLANSTLTNTNIQVLVNGSINTNIQKQLTSTPLSEQRVENGVTTTAQYGIEYHLTLSNIDTTVNQIKVRIPLGTFTDTSGNGQ